MIIYRFRLTSEDQEDFFREIEIQPSQTFLDFHEIIMSCSDLNHCDEAYFHTTDTHYKKKVEISLKKHSRKVQKYDEEMDEMVTETVSPPMMEKSKVRDFVEDPHQRMVYEFFGKGKFFFFLELFRIIKTEEIISLPRCVSKKGELPKNLEVTGSSEQEEEKAPVTPAADAVGLAAIFAGITEDDAELEEIENNLEEMLDDEDDAEAQVREKGEMEENEEDEQDQMESLDEYDDLEDLENRSRGFGNDSDDY